MLKHYRSIYEEVHRLFIRNCSNGQGLLWPKNDSKVPKDSLTVASLSLEQACRQKAGVRFLMHNVRDAFDDLTDIAALYRIKAVPAFVFFVGGAQVLHCDFDMFAICMPEVHCLVFQDLLAAPCV